MDIEWLEKALEDRSDDLSYLKVEPMFDALRSDPRFTELRRHMGLSADDHHHAQEFSSTGSELET
jgi:hypothetical protein